MGIIYLISVLMLLMAFILVKKTEKELNIISFTTFSILILFCYNTFISYILTFFTLSTELWLLTVINLIFSIGMLIKIYKDKQIQKYNFSIMDLLYIVLIATIVLIISYINFGFPLEINYETGDSTVHFVAANMFAKSNGLLNAEKIVDPVFGTLKCMRPMSYSNLGILINIINNIEPLETYKLFIGFGIFILFLTGTTMYGTLINFANKKEHKVWAFIISIICMLGYPLNSLLFGFEYLSMGLLIICGILYYIDCYEQEKVCFKSFIPIMGLLNFGLFLSYYMFVPFIYPAQWIYFCIKNYHKTKKIITKELILILTITLLIPFGLGYIYSLAPNIYTILIKNFADFENVMDQSTYLLNSGFKTNGYIYINLYSNMLLLIPLTIYLFIKHTKNKKMKNDIFIALVIFFLILFIELLLIANAFEKVSIYYLSKNYFALWIILLYCNYKALIQLSEKSNYLSRLFIGSYIFLAIIFMLFYNTKVEYYITNKNEKAYSVMDIFLANKEILLNKPTEYSNEEIDILKYAKKNLDYDKKIEVVTDENAYYWQYALLEHINEEDKDIKFAGQQKLVYKYQFLENKLGDLDYIIYFKKSNKYKQLKDKLFVNSETIYENASGGILRYKK